MRQPWWIGPALIALCAGCASQKDHREYRGARARAVDPPAAVLERKLVVPNQASQSFAEHTMFRVRGTDEDFRVITGPLSSPWLAADQAARGSFKNSSSAGEWSIEKGYAYVWGWWPVAVTPRVKVGAEGSAFLIAIDVNNFGQVVQEVVVFLEGNKATVDSLTGTNLETMPTTNTWVEVTGSAANPQVSSPADLSTASQRIQDVVKEAKDRRKTLEGW